MTTDAPNRHLEPAPSVRTPRFPSSKSSPPKVRFPPGEPVQTARPAGLQENSTASPPRSDMAGAGKTGPGGLGGQPSRVAGGVAQL